jgi:hypothetical protein
MWVPARLATFVSSPHFHHFATVLVAGASSGGDSGDPLSSTASLVINLVQFGIVGLLLIDIVGTHKFIVPRWVMDQQDRANDAKLALKDEQIAGLRTDLAEVKAANNTLQETTRERLIPALVQATDAQRAYVEELARRARRDD